MVIEVSTSYSKKKSVSIGRKVIIVILSVVFLSVSIFSACTLEPHVTETASIRIYSDNVSGYFNCIKVDNTIFLEIHDIANITNCDIELDDGFNFTRNLGTSSINKLNVYPDRGEAMTMGEHYKLPVYNYDGQMYLPLDKTLYLLHAQWCIIDGHLFI